MACRGCLQCLLKLTNFLLAIIGVSMVAYSLWMLNHHNHPADSPTPAPGLLLKVPDESLSVTLPDFELPGAWFIYATLGAGVFTTLISCTGLIGGETSSTCCLSCYTLGLLVLVTVQGLLAAAIILDRNWEDDFPKDPTGEVHKAEEFFRNNRKISRAVVIGVITIEVLGMLFSMILRTLSGQRSHSYDSDEEFAPAARRPLLPHHGEPGAPVPTRPPRTDTWSNRMREKDLAGQA